MIALQTTTPRITLQGEPRPIPTPTPPPTIQTPLRLHRETTDDAKDTAVPVSATHFAKLIEVAGEGASIRTTVARALDAFFRSTEGDRPAVRSRRRGNRRRGRGSRERRTSLFAELFAEQDGKCIVCAKPIDRAGASAGRLLREASGAFLCCAQCKGGMKPRSPKPVVAVEAMEGGVG